MAEFLSGTDDSGFVNQSFAFFGHQNFILNRHARFEGLAKWREYTVSNDVARIEVGPIYASGQKQPVADRSMLAFDLDVEDCALYLPCETAPDKTMGLTPLAWRHLALSTQLLDLFLRLAVFRADTTYRSLAVFSGRRGVHLWLPGKWRDWYNGDAMSAMLEAIQALGASETAVEMVSALRGDADGRRFLARARPYATEALAEESPLWSRHAELPRLAEAMRGASASGGADELDTLSVVLLSPQVDKAVTRQHTHLLKAPFSLHPRSGAISLPFCLHNDSAEDIDSKRIDVRDMERAGPALQRAIDTLNETIQ